MIQVWCVTWEDIRVKEPDGSYQTNRSKDYPSKGAALRALTVLQNVYGRYKANLRLQTRFVTEWEEVE